MSLSYRQLLLTSTLLTGGLAAQPALAQDSSVATPAGPQSQASAAPAAETGTGEIVVTGSLIRDPALVASAPVSVVGQEEIQLRQSNTAEEILRDLPGAVPSIGSAVNNGNGGSSFVDLRGLGSFRNVVLLDGVRITPTNTQNTLFGRTDLNNIPLALVERVDTLTGGAATTYGADAVSGVVNFITRSDFSGMEAAVSNQITERGDGNYVRADVTIGANFDDGRGNAVFSVGYQQSDPVYQGARSRATTAVDSFSGAFSGSGTAIPSAFTGTRPINPATGQPSTDPAVLNGPARQLNPATGQALATAVDPAFMAFNFNPYNIFQTPFERFNIYGSGRYELADGIEVYTRGLFSKNTVQTIAAASGDFGAAVVIPLSNPYLPAALRNQFCAFNVAPVVNGVPTGYTPRFSPAECAAAATATDPSSPAFRTVTANVSRRTTEAGPRIDNFTSTIFDYRAGVRIDVVDNIVLDLSGSYGESENIRRTTNYVLASRFRAAVYATNPATCLASGPNRDAGGGSGIASASAGPGCVPINIFGPDGSITPAQVPYIVGDSTITNQASLVQARGLLSGDFGLESPWASAPIGFALGSEYRRQRAQQNPDTLAQSGDLGGFGSAPPNIRGGFEVYEGYGEVIAPLIQDRPFFQELSVEAGLRYSHYKVFAPTSPTYNTTTYKAGGSWTPVEGIKIRGNYQRAVRAPNIQELFGPNLTALTNLSVDPCAGAAPISNATLRNVCLAQGAPAGTIGSINNPTAGQANATSGGNINLRPEKADSYTLGVVLQPRGLVPGLSLTVDYYNIKVKGAVSTPTPGDAISACFGSLGASSATDPDCTAIRRNPVTGGLDGDSLTTPGLLLALSNLGTAKTDGVDLGVNYRRDLGFARLSLGFQGNYTHDSKFKASPSSLNRECTGYYSVNCLSIQPEFYWNARATLTVENVDASLLWRHIDAVRQEPDDVVNGNGPAFSGTDAYGDDVDYGRIPAYDYLDLAFRVSAGDHLDFTFTVTNLLDKDPPPTGYDIGSTSFNSGNTYPSTYDALGRRYAVGARLQF